MQQREVKGMWGRYALFIVFSFGILGLNIYFNPPKRPERAAGPEKVNEQRIDGLGAAEEGGDPADSAPEDEPGAEASEPSEEGAEPDSDQPSDPEAAAKEPEVDKPKRIAPEPNLITLGSLDPNSPFAGLATFTNLGAALVRFELNGPRYHDLEDRSGYLGHCALDEIGYLAPEEMLPRLKRIGCSVDVVGPGTPAAAAGLKAGDLITSVDGRSVTDFLAMRRILRATEPKQTVELGVMRDGKALSLSATAGPRPLEVVRPERGDPLSFLLTLRQIDQLLLDDVVKNAREGEDEDEDDAKKGKRVDRKRDETINLELDGLDLRTGAWDIEDPDKFSRPGPHTSITFFRELPEYDLKVSKTFTLAEVADEEREKKKNGNSMAYHLDLEVAIENNGQESRLVAYQLDGPTGLPTEGMWFAHKVGRGWSGIGLRDVVHCWQFDVPNLTSCQKIATDAVEPFKEPAESDKFLKFIGVDAQYFSAIMIPHADGDRWFAEFRPLRVGAVEKSWCKAANTSCRLAGKVHTLGPGDSMPEQRFTVFAGPKNPDLLAKYNLQDLVYYGWFSFVAKPMLWTLHTFYALVGNYGLAIIMLTVLVRGCMFPMSIKQARGAQKMQELQPEIKKLHEKYKNNPEAKVKAQQELFRKHNYNPLSGCLVLIFQLPIFIGLYRALMVDVELRQAPLLWDGIRWCSNLAAPDMLFDWRGFMPEFVTGGVGLFGLGPYFNILPILTIALFLIQQKMFMPPPADEQAKMQHTMMKFMMIFMGLIFFKVASGLCLYFIASSLWGVAERMLLPKTHPPGAGNGSKTSRLPPANPAKPTPPQPKPALPGSGQGSVSRAGAGNGAGGKKKKKKRKKSRGRR